MSNTNQTIYDALIDEGETARATRFYQTYLKDVTPGVSGTDAETGSSTESPSVHQVRGSL